MCTIAVSRPAAKSSADVARLDGKRAQCSEELLGDPRGLLVGDRLRQRHCVGRLGRIGRGWRRDVQREEAAGEAGRSCFVQVEVLRRLAPPPMQHEVVVAVDDHCRILRAPVAGSPLVPEPLRILVAEDDPQLAELVESLLDEDGRFVLVGRASSGDQAVTLCAQHRPDIVLMDLGLPGLDGIEATRAIHARDAEQHIVIYTGSDEYDDVARADAAGAVGFLHKDALTSPDLAEALQVLHANHDNRVPDPD